MNGISHIRNLIFTLFFFSQSIGFAHGSLSARIAEKTVQINSNSSHAILYYERGLLFQQHEEYDKAIDDYLKSQSLGYTDNIVNYRLAQSLYFNSEFDKALDAINNYLIFERIDVKGKKLFAQIQVQLQNYSEALEAYYFVIDHTTDIRPEDIIECSEIILTSAPHAYNKALEILDIGLEKLGTNTVTLQIKKLDYLKKIGDIEGVTNQYNFFIASVERKEFWYFKKATYLFDIGQFNDCKIAIQQAKLSIDLLDTKHRNTNAINTLINTIKQLENSINHE